MKCILMNKNTEVLIAEYNELSSFFDEVYEIKNINYAPLIVEKAYHSNLDKFKIELSEWFKNRGIPVIRDDLDLLLLRLNITSPTQLLNKSYGLSLSDQYWIKSYGSNVNYDDINFFDNAFNTTDFLEASFFDEATDRTYDAMYNSPNNTTDGMLKKAWIIENGKRYLIKGGFKKDIIQPFNEVLASMICERLGFDHVAYSLDIINNKVVSKCENFITKDTELITAYQVLYGNLEKNSRVDYEKYITILERHGITNAREKIENMFILDYLIMNEDRHLNNFGIIRDVNTLEWLDIAPIFDNGQSLNILSYDGEELLINGEGRMFFNVQKFDDIIKIIRDIKRIDISKLDGIVEEFDKLLHEYQHITLISDERIYKLCVLLNRQINKLKDMTLK